MIEFLERQEWRDIQPHGGLKFGVDRINIGLKQNRDVWNVKKAENNTINYLYMLIHDDIGYSYRRLVGTIRSFPRSDS